MLSFEGLERLLTSLQLQLWYPQRMEAAVLAKVRGIFAEVFQNHIHHRGTNTKARDWSRVSETLPRGELKVPQ